MRQLTSLLIGSMIAGVSLTGCSSSGPDEAATAACKSAIEVRANGRQADMDAAFVSARVSQTPSMKSLVADADAKSGGVIRFTTLVEVCRGLGIAVPDRG